ncbi:hypothetical protein ACFS5M_14075 [Lacinutrix iliipiscaria]|uniref:Uncharacterized protein n=1 Tax=Lacinutrix iliipiscaria TaxID=1230532 RepID=A0ABW5WR89_9FLAO
MTTKTKDATTSKNVKKTVAPKKATQQTNGATLKKEPVVKLDVAKATVKEILKPTAKGRLNRLETLNILADKFNAVSGKYDELTHFMAGNDTTNAQMKFSSASNYSFTLRNPAIIDKILGFVETEFAQIVEKAEKEVLNFQV